MKKAAQYQARVNDREPFDVKVGTSLIDRFGCIRSMRRADTINDEDSTDKVASDDCHH